jgi:hypothetical protein
MKKFPKVKYPNDPETDGLHDGNVVVTEKLDGANFRFTWDENGTLDVGTRNVVYEDALHNENLPKAFEHAVEWVDQEVRDVVPDNDLISRFTYFGEAMHIHSLDYEDIDWHTPPSGSAHVPLDSEQPNVVLFDAYDPKNEGWVDWDMFLDLVHELDLHGPRVLERGDPNELAFDVPEQSMFGGEPEGIVARRVDGAVRAKKVTDSFKEKNAVSFNEPSKAQSDAAEFVAAYVTEPRIEKIAHKLVDEGEYDGVKMEMMEQLPKRVLQDVMAEHGWELLTSGGFEGVWDDDFKGEVRSKASKKCARTLKSVLQQF